MRELITMNQANELMLAVLAVAPVVGLIWGAAARRVVQGLLAGVLAGVGNFALWRIYNTITDKLGLDTVRNLLVNLAMFAAVGLAAGLMWGWAVKPKGAVPGGAGGGEPGPETNPR